MAIEIKAPAFQFYADHWLADENVRLLTLEETGAYIDAMAYCWREGSIPADPARLARLIGKGCSIEVATSVQRLFNVRSTPVQPGNERIEHKRLNEEREKQNQRRVQQSKAGEKSAESRRKGNQTNKKEPSQRTFNGRSTDVQHPCNSSSSSSDEDKRPQVAGKSSQKKVFQLNETGIPETLETDEFLAAWSDWIRHRKEIKKPLTETQAAKQLKEFSHWGAKRAVVAIDHTIRKGWQGIREPDGAQQPEPRRYPTDEECARHNPSAGGTSRSDD